MKGFWKKDLKQLLLLVSIFNLTLSVFDDGNGNGYRLNDWVDVVLNLSNEADEGDDRSEPPPFVTIVEPLFALGFDVGRDSRDTWDGNRRESLKKRKDFDSICQYWFNTYALSGWFPLFRDVWSLSVVSFGSIS